MTTSSTGHRRGAGAGGTDSVLSNGMRSMRRHSIILLAFAGAAAAAACETDLTPTIAHIGALGAVARFSSESTLVIAPALIVLPIGGTQQLITNAPDSLLSQLVWISQISAIATVNQSGVVTAGTPGTTIISVRYSFDTLNTASATVQVTGPVIP
ncbi:MAG: hypothetical protein ACREPM_06395 [Gemmatimonadaceae bacterium]